MTILQKRVTLPFGDYALENYPACVVERKGSIREVATNLLSNDRARFLAAVTRLAQNCPHPWLLLEGSLRKYLTPSIEVPCPGIALDALFQTLNTLRVKPLFVDTSSVASRLLAGELVLRILCSHAFAPRASA